MSTTMSERDWDVVLSVFRGCLPRRGDKARNDRFSPLLPAVTSGGAALFFGAQRHLARPAGTVWPLEFGMEAILAPEPVRRV